MLHKEHILWNISNWKLFVGTVCSLLNLHCARVRAHINWPRDKTMLQITAWECNETQATHSPVSW